ALQGPDRSRKAGWLSRLPQALPATRRCALHRSGSWSDNSISKRDWSSSILSQSDGFTQVIAFRPGQILIADKRHGAALAGVLHAGPDKPGIHVVASVHEHGARFDPVAKARRMFGVG